MEAEQAERVPGPSDNEEQGPKDHQVGARPSRNHHKKRSNGTTEQLQEDGRRGCQKKEKEIEKTTRAAMKFHVANFRKQEKQAAIQDKILKDIGANLEPDCSHPSFPVMIMDKGNGDLASITSIKKFNEVRKLAPTMMMGSRILWKWRLRMKRMKRMKRRRTTAIILERLLEMMMRDVIRDDEAHPDRLRGNGANDLPNVMQRLENTMERQNRQRDAMRNEIVAARGFRVF
ncbi:hypothetical protein CAEBREN_16139 [Caenorhabditis brenneri]|uniref:Uncharacterized protein n=1 Tax=Caenorhabditis brenneri TaxID=135651 RepID=G0NV31_CAEBE|nr:hypothetical protein CAEBREN_16139 [Caenorhabditis brenneri]